MPVQLENIQTLNDEDLQDLVKIYRDDLDQSDEDISNWLQEQLNSGLLLFAGRFNSRLLGATWAKQDGQNWQLEQLCVRTITRRRGVARQLLQLLSRHAREQDITLCISTELFPEEMTLLLQELDFEKSGQNWQLPPA